MASEVMNRVLECEKKCDERISRAKSEELAAAQKADAQAASIIEQAQAQAKKKAAEIIAEAEKNAKLVLENARQEALAQAEALKNASKKNESKAIDAVAAKVIEIS